MVNDLDVGFHTHTWQPGPVVEATEDVAEWNEYERRMDPVSHREWRATKVMLVCPCGERRVVNV